MFHTLHFFYIPLPDSLSSHHRPKLANPLHPLRPYSHHGQRTERRARGGSASAMTQQTARTFVLQMCCLKKQVPVACALWPPFTSLPFSPSPALVSPLHQQTLPPPSVTNTLAGSKQRRMNRAARRRRKLAPNLAAAAPGRVCSQHQISASPPQSRPFSQDLSAVDHTSSRMLVTPPQPRPWAGACGQTLAKGADAGANNGGHISVLNQSLFCYRLKIIFPASTFSKSRHSWTLSTTVPPSPAAEKPPFTRNLSHPALRGAHKSARPLRHPLRLL